MTKNKTPSVTPFIIGLSIIGFIFISQFRPDRNQLPENMLVAYIAIVLIIIDMRTKRRKKIMLPMTLIVIGVSVVGFGFFHQNRLNEGILTAFIAITLIIFSCFFIIFGKMRSHVDFSKSWLNEICTLLLVGATSTYFSPMTGFYFHEVSLTKSKEILETQIPKIEAYYNDNGFYPELLTDIPIESFGSRLPRYIDNDHLYRCDAVAHDPNVELPPNRASVDNHYRSNGEQYELCISHLDEISASGNKSIYSSTEKRWEIQYIYKSASWDK